MKRWILGLVVGLIATPVFASDGINAGDTAWMLTATALVLFMTIPGLSLFYGGMVRVKNVLSVLMQCFVITCLVTVVWICWAYSIAFGGEGVFWGGLSKSFLAGVGVDAVSGTIPETVFVTFQMTFAIITPALIVGAFVDRMRFPALIVFIGLWVLLVYAPIAHWVWGDGGWLGARGVLDFAGGTVVHINAGIAALVTALVLGKRTGYPDTPMPPHNLTLSVIGASMLWVGWFGFNAGSELAADGTAGMAMLVTQVATACAALGWMITEWIIHKKASVLGIITGAVAGLVAITPASGYVGPAGAFVIGLAAGVVCYVCVSLVKRHLKIDDSLDVFAVHGAGGATGTLLTGILVAASFGGKGLSADMSMGTQFGAQIVGVLATLVWSALLTFLIVKVLQAWVGLRVSDDTEVKGLDITTHGESGYNI